MIDIEQDLEALVLLELFLDTERDEREQFLLALEEDQRRKLLLLLAVEMGKWP
jgi:hypothetical protein